MNLRSKKNEVRDKFINGPVADLNEEEYKVLLTLLKNDHNKKDFKKLPTQPFKRGHLKLFATYDKNKIYLFLNEYSFKKGNQILSITSEDKSKKIEFKKLIKDKKILSYLKSNKDAVDLDSCLKPLITGYFIPGTKMLIEFKNHKNEKKLKSVSLCNFDDHLIFRSKCLLNLSKTDPADFPPERLNLYFKEFKLRFLIGYDTPVDVLNIFTKATDTKLETSCSKAKVNNKKVFKVSCNLAFAQHYLYGEVQNIEDYKVITFILDTTDLTEEKYLRARDNDDLFQSINNFTAPLKSISENWGMGEDLILYQERSLKEILDWSRRFNSDLYVFPYDEISLPYHGERTLEFRTYICQKDIQYKDNPLRDEEEQQFKNGRPLPDQIVFDKYDQAFENCLEEKLKFEPDEFDYHNHREFGYHKILKYHSCEININNRQRGYLELNKDLFYQATSQSGLALMSLNGEAKDALPSIKAWIRHKDPDTHKTRALKTLQLKKAYEYFSPEKADGYLQSVTNNSKIFERYEAMDLLLDIAVEDDMFSQKESQFLDKAAHIFNLNLSRYNDLKSVKIATVKNVEQSKSIDESILGLNDSMSKEEKCKALRKEFSKWNAQTNNNDVTIRKRAKQLVELAAKLRTEYNC